MLTPASQAKNLEARLSGKASQRNEMGNSTCKAVVAQVDSHLTISPEISKNDWTETSYEAPEHSRIV
jgi:hypothetical protein